MKVVVTVEALKPAVEAFRRSKLGVIEPEAVITWDVIKYLASLETAERQSLFVKQDTINRDYHRYTLSYHCLACATDKLDRPTKSGLSRIIGEVVSASKKGLEYCHICVPCQKAKDEAIRLRRELGNEASMERWRAEREATEQEGTPNFIEQFLTPNRRWKDDVKLWQGLRFLRDGLTNANEQAVAAHIKSLHYNVFLGTLYWRTIAWKVKSLANWQCSLCPSKQELNVHHRTYECHGYELQRLENDLVCLCRTCHETFHVHRNSALNLAPLELH